MVSNEHFNEPRNVGYSKNYSNYYQDTNSWVNPKSITIFRGKLQKDLFIFAMALGKYRDNIGELKDKQSNIPVQAILNKQKWALLSLGISETNNILCLKDENIIYSSAEKYAEKGMESLIALIDKYGVNFHKFLEKELKQILKEENE